MDEEKVVVGSCASEEELKLDRRDVDWVSV